MGDPDLIIIDEPTEGLAPTSWNWSPNTLTRLKERGHLGAAHRAEAIAMTTSDRAGHEANGTSSFQGIDELRANSYVRQGVAGGLIQSQIGLWCPCKKR